MVAQDNGMADPHVSHDTRSCRSVGSSGRHDAKLTADTLSHAGNAETERAAPRNKPLWRPSLRRHATVVAQDGGMAAGRFKHATSSCRSVLGTAGHDAKPPYSALIHAVISESERAAPRN